MKKAVVISCFNWYEDRIKLIRKVLILEGYETTVLLGDFNHVKKEEIENKYPECTYIHQIKYKKNISFKRIISHIRFSKDIDKEIKVIKPELIYVLVPLNIIAINCSKYKNSNPDVKLILDIIDLWPESMPIKFIKKFPLINTWRNWRNLAVDNSDFVFTECNMYKNYLSINEKKIRSLYLYKKQINDEEKLVKEIIDKSIVKNRKDRVLKFAYLGSINNIIDIEGICNVLYAFIKNEWECQIHIIGKGEKKDIFVKALKEMGCKVFFYGAIFDEMKKISILAPCDYAFNMMSNEVAVGLTIKSIDYLSYGLPLINNIKGDTWNIIDEYNIGINIENNKIINTDNLFDHNYIHNFFCDNFSQQQFVDSLKHGLKSVV